MNRLIIVGNGFDLSLGLKTGYQSFLLNYLEECFSESCRGNTNGYSDELLEIKPSQIISPLRQKYDSFDELYEYLKSEKHIFFNVKFELLKEIHQNSMLNGWIDIEVLYYDILVSKLGEKDRNSREKILKEYNDQFNFLKSKLIDYLSTIVVDYENQDFKDYIHNLIQQVSKPYVNNNNNDNSTDIGNIKFVNFNYTPVLYKSVSPYINGIHPIRTISGDCSINNIHGNLNNEDSIIFGYGDELDENYRKIENERSRELFQNIKSVHYPQNKEYSDIMWFVESDNYYDVHILGHSCGLSDRTLLNYILEKENCISIKVYHHNNDFFEKCVEISRCFKDKNKMREKIQPFDENDIVPQYNPQ